jgi:hypothetical protein
MHVEATIAALGKKKGEKYLSVLLEFAADDESLSNVMPLRPPAQREKLEQDRRAALIWLRLLLPTFMRRIGRA